MTNGTVRSPRAIAVVLALAACCGSNVALAEGNEKSATEKALENLVNGFYGTFDVSVDGSTKGMSGMVAYGFTCTGTTASSNGVCTQNATPKTPGSTIPGQGNGANPFGRVGFQPAISTNASGLGWRGSHSIPGFTDTKFLIQIEANVGITASPGVVTGYTAQTNGTRGAIGAGTTFVGFGGKDWGALKIGHGTTPYKKATDRLDPFAGMIGDMPVIMGNTGGDNRVEFNAVMDHAIWYESPKYDGFSYDLMFSPGQNRTADSNLNLSGGSSNCNGGNIPGSGNLPNACDDGGFNNAFSLAFKFEAKDLYLTAAYELHQNVNRNSDGIGSNAPIYANNQVPAQYIDTAGFTYINAAFPGFGIDGGTPEFLGDIANEAAYKVGAQYIIEELGLTVDAIFERMTRNVPSALQFQNERQRNGWWLAFTKNLDAADNISFGWAHAGKTPGDPGGQHNYNPNDTNDTADLFTLAIKHKLDKQLYLYANLAETVNHGNAHYDLGGGGHGIKTDCHDGTTTPLIDYSSSGNTTWGGCKPKAISIGMNYKF